MTMISMTIATVNIAGRCHHLVRAGKGTAPSGTTTRPVSNRPRSAMARISWRRIRTGSGRIPRRRELHT